LLGESKADAKPREALTNNLGDITQLNVELRGCAKVTTYKRQPNLYSSAILLPSGFHGQDFVWTYIESGTAG
jgi:hypothetical protein